VIGDYVSGAVSQPVGKRMLTRSLDNTLRVAQLVPTTWVLCDIHMHALAHGFAHGQAHLWSEDGVLLGTASQSVSVRLWTEDVVFTPPKAPEGATR
jgi:acyl-CoA thioesterase